MCRGLVACANNGESDSSNGSQFFITTERADELTRKYTIFGRISGETIFTVLRMQEVEVDDKDRPTDPPMITSCDVLLPPFDDIVPRTTPAEKREKAAAAMQAEKLADIQKRKKQGVSSIPGAFNYCLACCPHPKAAFKGANSFLQARS